MKSKTVYKILTDVGLIALLLVQMAYMLTGQKTHEWLGLGMFALVIVHNALNLGWYRNLFRGQYTGLRLLQTATILLTAVAMLSLAVSGMMMARHVPGFRISGGMSFARELHMAASYWGFALMSLHLGLHGSLLLGLLKQVTRKQGLPAAFFRSLRGAALLFAAYGVYALIKHDLLSYMLLKTQFVFFDFEQPASAFFIDYLAMMGFWVVLSHYVKRLLSAQLKTNRREEMGQ